MVSPTICTVYFSGGDWQLESVSVYGNDYPTLTAPVRDYIHVMDQLAI